MVGVTTAYLLVKSGLKSTIIDANKIGYGGSGRNTGKITSQHGIIYSKINQKYGIKYEGNNQALNLIEKTINDHNIDCNFKREDSYIFAQNENYLEELKKEYEICKKNRD